MQIETGKKYLITTDDWFQAPDGQSYRSVYGTVTAIESDQDTLGIKTNRGSTNWYLIIGKMVIAGCQLHYAIQCDTFENPPFKAENTHEGKSIITEIHSRTFVTE